MFRKDKTIRPFPECAVFNFIINIKSTLLNSITMEKKEMIRPYNWRKSEIGSILNK